jgi:hypothetical protein
MPFSTDDCVAFLKKQAASAGLPLQIYFVVSGKPIVVLTWEGSEPALPSVLLNSHMDVVPVFPVSSALKTDQIIEASVLKMRSYVINYHKDLASKVRWTGNIIIGDIILQLLFSF